MCDSIVDSIRSEKLFIVSRIVQSFHGHVESTYTKISSKESALLFIKLVNILITIIKISLKHVFNAFFKTMLNEMNQSLMYTNALIFEEIQNIRMAETLLFTDQPIIINLFKQCSSENFLEDLKFEKIEQKYEIPHILNN